MKKLLIVFLATATLTAYTQDKTARGFVMDEHSLAPVDSAKVEVYNSDIFTYTDDRGVFTIHVPKRRRHLEVSHNDYESKRVTLSPGFQHRDTKILLRSMRHIEKSDSTFYSFKNSLSLSMMEFLHVAIGIRYERFLHKNHSVGAHFSCYVYGRNLGNLGSEHDYYHEYQGFKLAPAYRYYPIRKYPVSMFAEGKIPFGYIHFSKLDYHSRNYTHLDIYKEYSTWTYGISISLGFTFIMPRTKHGLITISFGYQYFPIEVPEKACRTLSNDVTLCFPTDMDWWYFPGPGSYFETKFMIGGIF